MKQGRFFRPKPAALKGTPYDSLTEKRLHETIFATARFHDAGDKISYSIPHRYEPDFVIEQGGKSFIIEVKGYFQDRAECSKYTHISKALTPEQELIFIFEKPNKPMHFQSTRVDGTKMTHCEWATKHGFRWFDPTVTIEEITNE